MEEELLSNAKKFWNSAELVYHEKDYTSATILYFKCFFVLLDYILLKTIQKTPQDHTERFRLLEQHLPGLYNVLDKYYPIYRDTYTIAIEKEKCDEIRKHVQYTFKRQKIPL